VDLGEPPADRYVCGPCKLTKRQEGRGCTGSIDRELWKIEYCPVCGGEDEECFLCNGKGEISMSRCPRATADFRLLPFFKDYQRLETWPDGRGRLFQPVKLILAFDILRGYYRRAAVNYGR
jgi:hypothetical protein